MSAFNSAGESSPSNTACLTVVIATLQLLIFSFLRFLFLPELGEKSQVGLAESSNVWKDRG